MRAYERFLKYVTVWTTSDETSKTNPSAARELTLAYQLADAHHCGWHDASLPEPWYRRVWFPRLLRAYHR